MHRFLATGAVVSADVSAICELTTEGALLWEPSSDDVALVAYPSAARAPHELAILQAEIGHNLHGIRLGIKRPAGEWKYLRLVSGDGRSNYAERDVVTEVITAIDQLADLAGKAVRFGGRLASEHDEMRYCGVCQAETAHVRLINSPYGLPGAMMAGSARTTCRVCETAISIEEIAHYPAVSN